MSTEIHASEWVYLGRRLMADKKLGHYWMDLNPEGTDLGDISHDIRVGTHLFEGKNIAPVASVGSVFRVSSPQADMSSIYRAGPHRPVFLRLLDTPSVRKHLTESKADEVEAERRSLLKTQDKRTLDSMTLLELREHARGMLPMRQQAFIAHILGQLLR